MAIDGAKAPSSSGGKGFAYEGFYVNKMIVQSVELADSDKKDTAIIVKAVADDDENQYTKYFFMSGNFERDPRTGKVVDWKFPTTINDFFWRIVVDLKVDDEGEIDTQSFENAIGKEFFAVQYKKVPGEKYKYGTWEEVASIDEGPEDLAQRFQASCARGYPKKAALTASLSGSHSQTDSSFASKRRNLAL